MASRGHFFWFALITDTDKFLCASLLSRLNGPATMQIATSRFGTMEIEAEDVIHFPAGLMGLEECRQWVLLADSQNDAVAWLQSVERAEVALPVVSPRRFVPGYQMRVARRELVALELDDVKAAKVLTIVGKTDRTITLNLKAPLVINLQRCLGRQVVTNGDLPVQFDLGGAHPAFRRSA
jgi:flagellar assembly factor FliW